MSSIPALPENLDQSERRAVLREVVVLTAKLIRYSKGGLTPEERRDLASDLVELAARLLKDSLD